MGKLNLSKEAFKILPSWLGQARIFWWFLLSLFLVSFAGDWVGVFIDKDRLDRIRYAGWIFEMLGLFAVAYGLNNKLDLLDQKGIGERIREWGRSCPLLKRDTIFGVLGAEVELFGGDIRGRISASNNENMSLEAQVTFLLGAIQRLDKELGDLSSQQRKDFFEIKDELKQIEASLADEIKSVASRSAKAHVGDIGWELAGLGWVLIGITLATVPEFIHYWFGWLIELFEVLN